MKTELNRSEYIDIGAAYNFTSEGLELMEGTYNWAHLKDFYNTRKVETINGGTKEVKMFRLGRNGININL